MSAELMMTDETVKKSSIIANFLQNYCPFSSFYKTTLFLSSSLNIDSLHVSHNFKMLFHCLQVFKVLDTNASRSRSCFRQGSSWWPCRRRLSPSSSESDDYGRSCQVLPRGSARPAEAGEPVGAPWEAGASDRVGFRGFWRHRKGRKGAQRAALDPAPVN